MGVVELAISKMLHSFLPEDMQILHDLEKLGKRESVEWARVWSAKDYSQAELRALVPSLNERKNAAEKRRGGKARGRSLTMELAEKSFADYDPADLVDYVGKTREELKVAEAMLKDCVEMAEGEKSARIEGDLYVALISDREEVKVPDEVAKQFWTTVGAGKARNFFDRQTKVVYSKITDALNRLLEQPQGDPDLQAGKKLLKAGIVRRVTRQLRVDPKKKN